MGIAGWGLAYLFLGPIVRGPAIGWTQRLPVALTIATFLGVQAAAWERPSTAFHELVSQPAPHVSFLRRTVREHFPVWWAQVSADLHADGYSLPEMNEYDTSTTIQRSHTQFDSQVL